MKINEVLSKVNIDNKDGWGATPNNLNVKYLGLRVKMKPSVFLDLAAPLAASESNEKIQKHLENGGSIGAPFLDITVPDEWEDNDYLRPAKISSHEGRNRMVAIKNLYGDIPIEVHLFFRRGIRSRHITDKWKETLNKSMFKEQSSELISGPLFNIDNVTLVENKQSYDWLGQYTEHGYNRYPSQNVLNYLLNNYPNEEQVTLYRGLHFDTKEDYDDFMSKFNNKYDDDKISSWSPSYTTAEEFAMTKKTYHPTMIIMSQETEREKSKEYMTGYRGIVLKTVIPPNTGINVNRTNYSKEDEVILPPGSYDIEIQTVKKKFKHTIEDGDETITSIIDKMIDPKYKDDQYYRKFFEFIKHNYPEEIRQSDELKNKIVKIINSRHKKVNPVSHEIHKWEFVHKYTDVRIYFNYSIFELFDKGFLPDGYEKYLENYANRIIQEYYNLLKKYSGKDYVYELGSLRFIEPYASSKYKSMISKILAIQVGNVYNMMNDREEIDKINSIKDSAQRKKALDEYTGTIKRIFGQLKN